ncbi:hypothetical protein GYMLUDRAFT_76081 [Collybiopsis luxurians FD-317 M1]|uniref:ER-bound oxygenase mpaB/mpaB'/Rubber oxygenase catalytic domain-containing protein n=1 Tax=Collybiopsis luxurians FD-317 M1 TaxID=944289 RepID=A0A0D0CMU5_9AGAR|nr:hypothetical protein GYMLUDRAFT_76081 [Collybiopsis luxurians FD-317 M1]
MTLWTHLPFAHVYGVTKWPMTTIGLVVIAYLSAARALRWRRYNAIHRKYQAKYVRGDLSPEEAQEIIHTSALYDMPMLINYSLSFALFKTYAIPTISKILSDTKELKSAEGVSKRYADTEIMISTWVFCPISGKSQGTSYAQSSDLKRTEIDDPRAMIALARVNWLHSKYPITNDDYLYTLGVFIFEPPTWASLYGWRALSPMESQAFYIFWIEIGRRMGIKDIPESREAFKQWIHEYEDKVMVPAQTNHDVATYTTEELLHAVPERFGIKNFARRLTICALEENVRVAMMQPSQPFYLHAIFKAVLHSVGLIQGYLCLPRSQSNPGGAILVPLDKASYSASTSSATSKGPTKSNLHRMHPKWFQARPWYMPEPTSIFGKFKNQMGLKFGLYDQLPGEGLRSEGYRLEEMGPVRFEKLGNEEAIRNAEKMYGCPITGPFSRN